MSDCSTRWPPSSNSIEATSLTPGHAGRKADPDILDIGAGDPLGLLDRLAHRDFGRCGVGDVAALDATAFALAGTENDQLAAVALLRDHRRNFRRSDVEGGDQPLRCPVRHVPYPLLPACYPCACAPVLLRFDHHRLRVSACRIGDRLVRRHARLAGNQPRSGRACRTRATPCRARGRTPSICANLISAWLASTSPCGNCQRLTAFEGQRPASIADPGRCLHLPAQRRRDVEQLAVGRFLFIGVRADDERQIGHRVRDRRAPARCRSLQSRRAISHPSARLPTACARRH